MSITNPSNSEFKIKKRDMKKRDMKKRDMKNEVTLDRQIAVSNPVNCVLCGKPLTDSERLYHDNCCDLCWLSNGPV